MKHDSERAIAKQVTHTEHISEAVQLLALCYSVLVDEGLWESFVALDADLLHKHVVAIVCVLGLHIDDQVTMLWLFTACVVSTAVIICAIVSKHSQTVDVESLFEHLLDVFAFDSFLRLGQLLRRGAFLWVTSRRVWLVALRCQPF